MTWLTPFCTAFDAPAKLSDPKDPNSLRVGKVTHPSGAPENHLLTVWSGMMPARQGRIIDSKETQVDAGIYLIKEGRPFWEPGDMVLIVSREVRGDRQTFCVMSPDTLSTIHRSTEVVEAPAAPGHL